MYKMNGLALFSSIIFLLILSILMLGLLHNTALSNKIAFAYSARLLAIQKAMSGIDEFKVQFINTLSMSDDKYELLTYLDLKDKYFPISQSYVSARYFSEVPCQKVITHTETMLSCHLLIVKSIQYYGGKEDHNETKSSYGHYEHIENIQISLIKAETAEAYLDE